MMQTARSSSINKANAVSWYFMSILASLMAFTSLSTDVYLPAMPQMAHDLQGNIELTITGFLIGFALAQLIWGPISDRVGRKKPLYIGMILFIIGSVGCALSQTIGQILFWRIFQAVGACTGPMLARAIIRDLFANSQAARALSTLTIIMTIVPIAGPLLGGQIIKFSTWHSVFWFLAAVGIIMFASLFLLPETHPSHKRTTTFFSSAFTNYRQLIKSWQFMRYTLCVTFFYVAAYTFIVGSPFVYISFYGIDSQHYGWLFALNIVGVIGFSFLNRYLVKRFYLDTLLKTATVIALLALLTLFVFFYQGIAGFYSIIVTMFIFFSMIGIVSVNATASALDGVPKMAGAASALMGSLQYGSGIVSSLLLVWASSGNPMPMIFIMLMFTLASTVIIFISKSHGNSI